MTIVSKQADEHLYGDTVKLTGTVRGGKVDVVTVEVDEYPFDRYRRAGAVKPDSRGRFSFKHKPRFNARYRAVAGSATSAPFPIYVSTHPRVRGRILGPSRIRVTEVSRFPAEAKLASPAPHVVFYMRRHGDTRFHRIGESPFRRLTPTEGAAAITREIAPRTGDRFRTCTRRHFAIGMGGPAKAAGCGRSTQPERNPLTY